LSRPADGASPSLGVVIDNFAEVHAWRETLVQGQYETIARDIPVGAVIQSAATHVDFHLNGRFYHLTMGPEVVGGACTTTSTHGRGTTQATIRRASATEYSIEAPEGTIARLFDITDKLPNAVDKGLYYISFRIDMVAL
jgi:hypothetical protein